MTDQQRADLCAREGFPLDTTPALDRLARHGVWFDRAYTTTPVCGPARESFLTGRWPTGTGIYTNSVDPRGSSAPRYESDLFDVCTDAGFATALIGKNHSHLTSERVDYWDTSYSHNGGSGPNRTDAERAMDDWVSDLNHGVATDPAPYPPETSQPFRMVNDACEWIESVDEHFCLWLSFPEPHNPFYAPEPYFSMFPPADLPSRETTAGELEDKGPRWSFLRNLQASAIDDINETIPRYRSNYLGMLRLINDQIDRFLSFLDDAGLRDDTLVIFTSDHGDFVGEYGLLRKGDRTANVLTRIPMVVDGPEVVSSDGAHPAHVSIADIMPTVCDTIGEPIPEGVQGRSLAPVLADESYPEQEFESVYVEGGYGGLPVAPTEADRGDWLPDSIGFHELNEVQQSGRACSLRKGEWKLDIDADTGAALYDVSADPMETTNLIDDAPEIVVRSLSFEIIRWQLRLTDTLGSPAPASASRKRHPRNYRSGT